MRTRALVLGLFVLVGCVKKSTHEHAVAALNGTIGERDQAIADRDKTITDLQAQLKQTSGDLDSTAAEMAELQRMRDADQKRLAAYQALQERFQALVDSGDLEIAYRRGQMTLKLPSGVLFPSASADLSEAGKKTLAKVTKVLMTFTDRRFLVAGHTDNVPIKTDAFANNWYLSTARAISVVQYMVEQGFPAKQLGAAGYAENDPVRKNKTKKGRQKNRRIEIILLPDLSELPKLAQEPEEEEVGD